MRILQVMAGAPHGGAETAFVDMCIAMKEAGQDIVVATRANDIRVPRLRAAGIEVHTMPFGGAIDIYTPFALRRVIRGFRPEIVLTWMARAAQKVPPWKASMGIEPYQVVSRLGGYYKIKNFKATRYFVTITPDIARYLVESGVPAKHVRFIANFAETEEISALIDREAQGAPENATLLLALGRLHTSKAFDVLIKAVAQVPQSILWIAGEGPERENLEALIDSLGVSDRVKLLGWRSDRAALLAVSDICVFPSRYEPFGTVFLQAWANKVPLIASESDGPRQFVRHEEDGLMVAVDDVDGLRDAILRLSGDRVLAGRLVENGYQRYINEFTKEKSVENYLNYFHEIITRENPQNTH